MRIPIKYYEMLKLYIIIYKHFRILYGYNV